MLCVWQSKAFGVRLPYRPPPANRTTGNTPNLNLTNSQCTTLYCIHGSTGAYIFFSHARVSLACCKVVIKACVRCIMYASNQSHRPLAIANKAKYYICGWERRRMQIKWRPQNNITGDSMLLASRVSNTIIWKTKTLFISVFRLHQESTWNALRATRT